MSGILDEGFRKKILTEAALLKKYFFYNFFQIEKGKILRDFQLKFV
jgi:hypothetical protein